MQKSEKFHPPIFHKTKNLIFHPSGPWATEQDFVLKKNTSPLVFKFDGT